MFCPDCLTRAYLWLKEHIPPGLFFRVSRLQKASNNLLKTKHTWQTNVRNNVMATGACPLDPRNPPLTHLPLAPPGYTLLAAV